MTYTARFLIKLCWLMFLALGSLSSVHAARIAVIGTGNVGGALGPEFAALGHEIVYGSRSPQREDVIALVERTGGGATAAEPAAAVRGADIVVLAVPGLMVKEITQSLGNLDDKIIIDPTNPLGGWDEGNLTLQVETSNADVIQRAAPGAHVVKAFSTLNYQQMIHPEKSSGPISIMLAGDSSKAKAKVAELAAGIGLEPIDVGTLEAAHYVEGMAILLLNNRIQKRASFEFHLRKNE